jgi:hypothetical protein
VVEEGVLVASLDWVAEEVFAAGVAECNELSVPLDAFWADRSNIVVADTLSNLPLGIVALRVGGGFR